jgi:hypothetical protein
MTVYPKLKMLKELEAFSEERGYSLSRAGAWLIEQALIERVRKRKA